MADEKPKLITSLLKKIGIISVYVIFIWISLFFLLSGGCFLVWGLTNNAWAEPRHVVIGSILCGIGFLFIILFIFIRPKWK